jgi:hypothetical protein
LEVELAVDVLVELLGWAGVVGWLGGVVALVAGLEAVVMVAGSPITVVVVVLVVVVAVELPHPATRSVPAAIASADRRPLQDQRIASPTLPDD